MGLMRMLRLRDVFELWLHEGPGQLDYAHLVSKLRWPVLSIWQETALN